MELEFAAASNVDDGYGYTVQVRCEPPPAAFGGSPPHEGENNVIVPLVRGTADGVGRGWLTPHSLCKADPLILDWEPLVRQILDETRNGVARSLISARFHNTLAAMIVDIARWVGEPRVVLSGGCFQNRYLSEHTVERLRHAGFSAYWHQRMPPNDGGLALGQIVAAQQSVEQEKPCVLQFQAR
jgi:hypothetical protein